MNNIGKKLRAIRRQKGLSQEALAEASKVNLRTIQRIENNDSEPRGKTLHLICEVLEVNAEDLLDYGKETDADYLIIFHLSVIAFVAIPVGNIILPLILWMNKKDKIIDLKEVGANLLNFQIVWSVLAFGALVGGAFLKVLHNQHASILLNIFIGLLALNIILPIIFAIKTKKGRVGNLYPKLLPLLK